MNTHDFYNLLEGRRDIGFLKNSAIHSYPDDFLARYNACADEIDILANRVTAKLTEMAALQKEQCQYWYNKDEKAA